MNDLERNPSIKQCAAIVDISRIPFGDAGNMFATARMTCESCTLDMPFYAAGTSSEVDLFICSQVIDAMKTNPNEIATKDLKPDQDIPSERLPRTSEEFI